MGLVLYVVAIFVVISGFICRLWLTRKDKRKSICIVVLGDLGRSPRMQYHAISFLKEGFAVEIIAYAGSEPLDELRNHESVRIAYLKPLPEWNDRLPRLIAYVVKTVWQSATLLHVLFKRIRTSYLMIQNPPAIPTIPICWLFSKLTATQFVIDWHNYAYTIMALSIGRENFLVAITRCIEGYFGAKTDKNFCVTRAMKEDLSSRWNVKSDVLYDKPPQEFRPIDASEKRKFLTKLKEKYDGFDSIVVEDFVGDESASAGTSLKKKRPALIVSSTSWTEDEDFSILFQALADYEIACSVENSSLPDLICVITGKGPLKDFWNAIIKLRKWQHVRIVTPWLENEDYPLILASADLGVCLHTSSSGLDLPMKVVDMFGCGLPVCAYNFQCLDELVKHEENSLIFSNYQELSQQLISWFTNFPNNPEQMRKDSEFREQLRIFQETRWHGNWSSVVLPCFD